MNKMFFGRPMSEDNFPNVNMGAREEVQPMPVEGMEGYSDSVLNQLQRMQQLQQMQAMQQGGQI